MKDYDLSHITFSNDFMFCTVLNENLDLAKELVEVITERKVREITHSSKQQTLDNTIGDKGVRLDVYFEDDETVYDVEMQRGTHENLPLRARYYQSAIDQNILSKGRRYEKLKNSYIIFICTFDPFKMGRSKYTFRQICEEDKNILLGDGSTKIFLNAASNQNDVSKELKDLLKYVYTGTSNTNNLVQKIDDAVISTRNNDTWRSQFMTLEEEVAYMVRTQNKDLIMKMDQMEKENDTKTIIIEQMEKENDAKNIIIEQMEKENKRLLENVIAYMMSTGLTEEEAKSIFNTDIQE